MSKKLSVKNRLYLCYISNPYGDWHTFFKVVEDQETEGSQHLFIDNNAEAFGFKQPPMNVYLKLSRKKKKKLKKTFGKNAFHVFKDNVSFLKMVLK